MAKETIEIQIALMRARVQHFQNGMLALVRVQRAEPKRREELQRQINEQRGNRDRYQVELDKLIEQQRRQQVAERQRLAREEFQRKQAQPAQTQQAAVIGGAPIAAGTPGNEQPFMKALKESMRGFQPLMHTLENVDADTHTPMQQYILEGMRKLRNDALKYLQDVASIAAAAEHQQDAGAAMGQTAAADRGAMTAGAAARAGADGGVAPVTHDFKQRQGATAGMGPAMSGAGAGGAAAGPAMAAAAAAPAGKTMGDITPALDAIKQTYDRLNIAPKDQKIKGIRETIKKIIEAMPNITIRMEEFSGVMVPIIRPQDETPNSTRAAQLFSDLIGLYEVEIMRPERGPGHVLYTKRYSEQEQQNLGRPDRGLDLKDIMEWYPELRQMVDMKSAQEFLKGNVESLKETGDMLRQMGDDASTFAAETLERNVEALYFIVHGEQQSAADIISGRRPGNFGPGAGGR